MIDWHKNKTKGDFAEMICKRHFKIMGYEVYETGIEKLAPSFAKLQSNNKYITNIKKYIQNIPDFLVVCPDTKKASFVEAKYRTIIDTKDEKNLKKQLKEISKELHTKYNNLISQDIPIYFYLVTNTDPYIFIMKAKSLKYKEDVGGFYTAGEDKALSDMKFFKRNNTNPNDFNTVYSEVIKPYLDEHFKN